MASLTSSWERDADRLSGSIRAVADQGEAALAPLADVLAGYADLAQDRRARWRRKQHLADATPERFNADDACAPVSSEPGRKWPLMEVLKDASEQPGVVVTVYVEAVPTILEQARTESLSMTATLERLLAVEVDATAFRRLAGRLRFASIPTPATLDDFDYDAQPGVDRPGRRGRKLLWSRSEVSLPSVPSTGLQRRFTPPGRPRSFVPAER